jgi:hypothetical protein
VGRSSQEAVKERERLKKKNESKNTKRVKPKSTPNSKKMSQKLYHPSIF